MAFIQFCTAAISLVITVVVLPSTPFPPLKYSALLFIARQPANSFIRISLQKGNLNLSVRPSISILFRQKDHSYDSPPAIKAQKQKLKMVSPPSLTLCPVRRHRSQGISTIQTDRITTVTRSLLYRMNATPSLEAKHKPGYCSMQACSSHNAAEHHVKRRTWCRVPFNKKCSCRVFVLNISIHVAHIVLLSHAPLRPPGGHFRDRDPAPQEPERRLRASLKDVPPRHAESVSIHFESL